MAANVCLCAVPAKAQFNTVAAVPARYKVEVSGKGTEHTLPVCENGISTEEIPKDTPASEDMDQKKWMERYLSVSYPLRRIRVTSPYGYRKDPFTGKRKFHGGLDLHARGDEVMAMITSVIEIVKERLNPNLKIGGILITQYDKRKTLNKSVAEIINDSFCDKVFGTVIRDNVALAEAPIKGENIFEYNKNCNGAKDYMELAKEVLKLK